MSEFCFTNLIKEPTCYKNADKPTSIDHILRNHTRCFQYFSIYETGLSDFHELTFKIKLKQLSLSKLQKGDFDKFKFVVNSLLESHAPMKENYVRRKQAPFMNKSVRKIILVQAQLLNKFRKENLFINKLAYKR